MSRPVVHINATIHIKSRGVHVVRFRPQLDGLEDRIVLDGEVESMTPNSISPPADYQVTMEPEAYTYSDWADAFLNFFDYLGDAVSDAVAPDDSYIWDGLGSPTFIQP